MGGGTGAFASGLNIPSGGIGLRAGYRARRASNVRSLGAAIFRRAATAPSSRKVSPRMTARDRFGDLALHEGMHGEHVKELQGYLRSVGLFRSDDTGYFGEVTSSAVAAWQKAHGLSETGIWDATSMAAYEQEQQEATGKRQGGNRKASVLSVTPTDALEGPRAPPRSREPRGRVKMRGSLDMDLTDQGMEAKFRRESPIDTKGEAQGSSNHVQKSVPLLHAVASADPVEAPRAISSVTSSLGEQGLAYVAAVVLATAGAIWAGSALGLLEFAGFGVRPDLRRSRRLGSRAAPRPSARRYAPSGEYGDRSGGTSRPVSDVQLPRKVREPPLPPVSPRRRDDGTTDKVERAGGKESKTSIPLSVGYRTGDEDDEGEGEEGSQVGFPESEAWLEPPAAQAVAVDMYPPRPRAVPPRRTPTLPPGMDSGPRAKGTDGSRGFASTRREILRQMSQEMGGSPSKGRGHGLQPVPGARSPRPTPDLHEGRNAAGLPTFDADSYAHWEHWNERTRLMMKDREFNQ